jgi:hypothetical protein
MPFPSPRKGFAEYYATDIVQFSALVKNAWKCPNHLGASPHKRILYYVHLGTKWDTSMQQGSGFTVEFRWGRGTSRMEIQGRPASIMSICDVGSTQRDIGSENKTIQIT